MESDETRSVRVEFDGQDSSPDAPMVGGSPGPAKRALPLLMVLVVLAALVFLLFSLRPDADQAVEEIDPVPTTTAPSTVIDSTTSTTIATVEKITQIVPATGLREQQEMARSNVGFLALQFEEAENGPPRLLGSSDGLDWSPVTTSLDATSDQLGSVILRDYESLIATDSGFALLMTSLRLQERQFTPGFEVMRLTSPDGAVWTRDPDFETIQGTVVSAPFHHDSESFGVVQLSQSQPIAAALLQQALDNDVAIPEVCMVSRIDLDQIEVESCDASEALIVRRQDVVDPERFGDLTRCIFALQSEVTPSEVAIVRRGRNAFAVGGVPLFTVPPLVIDETTLVAFDEAPELSSNNGCVGFLEPTEPQAPSMIRWSAGVAGPTRFELPPEVERDLPNSLTEPVVAGNRVVFVLDSGVWEMSAATGEWSRLVELPDTPPTLAPFDIALPDDGSGLVIVTGNRIATTTFDDLTWEFAPLLRTDDNPSVINLAPPVGIDYVDAEQLIISNTQGAFIAQLPLQDLN